AADWSLCRQGPLFDFYRPPPQASVDRLAAPARASADRVDVGDRRVFLLEGDALIERADQRLAAQRLRYDAEDETFEAEGPVHYQDRDLLLAAGHAQGDLSADRTRLAGIQYQLLSARG